MGSEIFKLKSLDLEPTVVRGARAGFKNSKTTPPLGVNYSDSAVVYSGERGVTREYLVQSSLSYNDFKGAATFTNGSDVATGYTGPFGPVHGDVVRHDGDTTFYTVTGVQGDNVYLTQAYSKVSDTSPDESSGPCTVRRILLDSVNYETYEGAETGVPFYFDKELTEWHPTGIDSTGPYVAYSGPIDFSTGVEVQFFKATKPDSADLSTVGSVRKTLIDNNAQDVTDVSLSPLPYPHSSLKVWWGVGESGLQEKTEFEDYVVNYSQSPDFAYPYPPYEERRIGYIKFLDRMQDEVQVTGIGPATAGIVAVSKEVTVQSSGAKARKPIQRIIYGTDSVSVGVEDIGRFRDYVMDYDAGTLVLVDHSNAESPYDHVAVPREVMWNGVSVIRGVPEDEVRNFNDLVIPGVTGLLGIDGVLYFEDADQNNLVSGTDYVVEFTSGAVRLTDPLKRDEAVLVSYYIEGDDVEREKLSVSDTRLNKYPILRDSVTILKRWSRTDQYGRTESGSTVLVEGTDFEMSYFTGHVRFITPTSYSEDVTSIEASYTPLSQANCILQSKEGDRNNYRMTMVDDAVEVVEPKDYIFKVDNPVVSIPVEDYFKQSGDPTKYSFSGTVLDDAPIFAGVLGGPALDTTGWTYDDQSRQLRLQSSRNDYNLIESNTVLCTYSFEGDVLPYAPVQVTYPFIAGGTSQFLIEGFDRTDVIKAGTVIRVDNRDPVARYYFIVDSATYEEEGTYVIVKSSFQEDINAPLFNILDGSVIWEDMPQASSLDTDVLLGADTLTFTGGVVQIQQAIKPNTLIMIDATDVYSVTSVDVVDDEVTIGIQPPLVRANPSSVVHSRTPVYDVGDTTLSMRHFVLDDVPEPAFTVSYVSPEGFDGSGMVFVDPENVVLFESVNGVPNPIPYVYRKRDYPSVNSLAYAIQATKSVYNNSVSVGPRVPDYNPFTVSPADVGERQYYLDSGTYSPDLVDAFDDPSPARLPYTLMVSPELLKWSLLRAYRGQSSVSVRHADLTGRFSYGDVMAFAFGAGQTGIQYMGVTGISAEIGTDGVLMSKIFLEDSFRANIFDPSLYVKRSVQWVDVPNDVVSLEQDNTILRLSGEFRSMLKPGTMLRIGERYVHMVEEVTSSPNSISLRVYPPLLNDTVVMRPNYRIEQTAVPVCLTQSPDQPYMLLSYTPDDMHTGFATVAIDSEKVVLVETVDNFLTKTTELPIAFYQNIVELADAIGKVESVVSGIKPFSAVVPDAYKVTLEADSFDRYLLDSVNEVYLPYAAKVAVGSASVSYTPPTGYTGVGYFMAGQSFVTLRESIMPVTGVGSLEKDTVISYATYPSFFDALGAVSDTESVIPGVNPYQVDYMQSRSFVGDGSWDRVHTTDVYDGFKQMPSYYYVTTDYESWEVLGPLNVRRLDPEDDYTIDNGLVELEEEIGDLDRFSLSYMGRDVRAEDEGEPISVTCRYFSSLAAGSRLDVYMDYKAIDQFYIQKLTERDFSGIVVVPQIEELLEQLGSGGGQGADTAPDNGTIQNWKAGVINLYYALQDEEIKKSMYLKFYHWYKERLRNFSSELQLTMGFKFAKSNAVGEVDGRLTLQDEYVETEDYTLTTDDEIAVVPEGYSKFFPIGYGSSSPRYYPRFGKSYRLYNDVYCFNVRYRKNDGSTFTKGYIKSVKPYWTENLDHVILKNTNDNLIAYYEVPIQEDERTFSADDSKYSWLKRVSIGDKINIGGNKKQYTIVAITSGHDSQMGSTYELIELDGKITKKGVRTFRLRKDGEQYYYWVLKPLPVPPFVIPVDKKTESEFMSGLPGEGRNIILTRPEAEDFPVFDDEGSYGFKIEAGTIEGYDKDDKRKNRIRKFSLVNFLRALFPLIPTPDIPENVRVQVGRYDEDTLEFVPTADTTVVEIDRLSRIEQRKVSSTQEALYINKIDEDEVAPGLSVFSYLDFGTVYAPDEDDGYTESFVVRSKDRDSWVRFYVQYDENGDALTSDVAEEYGFIANEVYKGFYDPDNMYRWLLMEKQAWQTEEAILKDLYDYNDKLARAYKQARLRLDNVSPYKGYLANYRSNDPAGVSDWLSTRLTKYERALYFLVGGYAGFGDQGSVLGILRPDGVHDENEASPQIAQSYANASVAYARYLSFYSALQEYKYINSVNNSTWKSDYVRWVLGLVEGVMHQKTSREMVESEAKIEIGLVEDNAVSLSVVSGTRYAVTGGSYAVSGDMFYLFASLVDIADPARVVPPYSRVFSLRTEDGEEYVTLLDLASTVSGTRYDGVRLFSLMSVYPHYPYNDETCKFLLRGSWTLVPTAVNYLKSTNVEDHRSSDPRILYLNQMVEDKLPTDNQDDPGNPYWVWPLYTSNGNIAKRAIDGLPVAGSWEKPNADFYEVMRVRCLDENWGVLFGDFGEDGSGIIDAKTYMGPQDILAKIDNGQPITTAEYQRLVSEVEVDPPRVSILKYMSLVRHGIQDTSLTFNLREYDTVQQLVDAINAARFNSEGEQDPVGNLKLFEAEVIGGEEHGRYRSYEISVDYNAIKKNFTVQDTGSERITYKYNFVVGWELVERSTSKMKYLRFSVHPQKYSVDPTANFFMDEPEVAYQSTLNNLPLGLRKDIRAFDLYCWDEVDGEGRREYEVRDNVMYFRSANVPGTGVPLASSGDPLAPDRETLSDLVGRINSHPVIGKWFYANLQFTRDDVRDPGYFEYGYLPDFKKDVPKATLQDFVLRKDTALRLTSTESVEYFIEPDGPYDPLDEDTVFNSLRLRLNSDVRSLVVREGTGYSMSSSSMVVDDGLNTLDLSATYSYPYQYSQTFQFSDTSYDTIGELVTSLNSVTIPGVGGALFAAVLNNDAASTTLVQRTTPLTTTPRQFYKFNASPPPTYQTAFTLAVTADGANYAITNARCVIPASRTQMTVSCTITYTGTYTPATIDISPSNYTIDTLATYISTLKPYPDAVFNPIFPSAVFNEQYENTDASNLLDVTTTVDPEGYARIRAVVDYDFAGRTLAGVALDVTADQPSTGVTAEVIGGYGPAEANLLVPSTAYAPLGVQKDLVADFRALIGMRMLNMFNPSYATFYGNYMEVVADGNYSADLPLSDKNLHGWIDRIRGGIQSGMLGVQVLPLKNSLIAYGVPEEQSQALTYNEPTYVFFGVMGDIKFVQISDNSLHLQMNNVKRRLGKPWTINGVLEEDHYTPERYDGTDNYDAIDIEHFLGWLRNTRYMQIRDGVVDEALVANKHLWLYLKFHREVGCDQKAYQYRRRIETVKNSQESLWKV